VRSYSGRIRGPIRNREGLLLCPCTHTEEKHVRTWQEVTILPARKQALTGKQMNLHLYLGLLLQNSEKQMSVV
jgi:hypothetical protein